MHFEIDRTKEVCYKVDFLLESSFPSQWPGGPREF